MDDQASVWEGWEGVGGLGVDAEGGQCHGTGPVGQRPLDAGLVLGGRGEQERHDAGVGEGDVDQDLDGPSVAGRAQRQVLDLVEHLPAERLRLGEHGLVQGVLAGVVVQQPGLGQPDGVGDVLHRRLGEAAAGEQGGGAVEDALVDLLPERSRHATTVRPTDRSGRSATRSGRGAIAHSVPLAGSRTAGCGRARATMTS
jgi:hypothetical protein